MDRDLIRKAIFRVRSWAEKKREDSHRLPGMDRAVQEIRTQAEKTRPYEPVIEIDALDEDRENELQKIRSLRERLRSKGI